MSTIDDQLAQLLGQNSALFSAYDIWSSAQAMLISGTINDPASFNSTGGTTGDLGYYPVVSGNGTTIYVPCIARLQAIASNSSDPFKLVPVTQQATTTNATQTVAFTNVIPVSDIGTADYTIYVEAQDGTGNAGMAAIRIRYARAATGSARLLENVVTTAFAGDSALNGCAVVGSLSGNNIQIKVTGLASTTIRWTVTERRTERTASTVIATSPSAPTLSVVAGNGQNVLTYTDGSNGGSAITSHSLYRSTTSGSEVLIGALGASPYTDAGLTNGTTYYYKITATNSVGEGAKSTEASATPASSATVPAAPTLSVSAGNAQNILTYTDGSNGGATITSHSLYRSTTSGTEVLIGALGASPYTDSGLTNGTTYYYKITATNSVGEGAKSAEASATPATPATVPAAPTLSVVAGNGQNVLTYTDGSNGGATITGHSLYRGTSAGTEVLIGALGASPYTDAGLTNGTTYYYKITATNAVGEGTKSAETSATPVTVPSAPTLSVVFGNGQNVLTYTDGSNGGSAITSHSLYRSTTSGSEVLIGALGASPYTDSSLTNGTTYYYKITATNSVGEGAKSAEASATPATTPAAPTLTVTPGNAQNVLSWVDGSSGGSTITGHNLYKGTASGGETLLGTITSGSPYTDTGLTNGTTYYYKIAAVNSVGVGTLSQEQSATPAVPVTPSAFTVTQLPYSNQIFQRTTTTGGGLNKGTGTIPVSINVTTAGGVYARIRSASDGTTILQPSWLVNSSVATGSQSINVTSVDSRLGWFYLDLSGDSNTWTQGTTPVGMGDLTLISGQSLAAYFMAAIDSTVQSTVVTPSPYASIFATYGGNLAAFPNTNWPAGNLDSASPGISGVNWEIQTDTGNYRGTGSAQYLKDMVTASGVNQGLVGNAIGATPISKYIPTGSPAPWTQLHTVMNAAGNKFSRFIWYQGHNDQSNAQLPYSTTYYSNLTTLWNDISPSIIGGISKFYLGGIPDQTSRIAYGSEVTFNPIRLAQAKWAVDNGATFLDPRGIDLADRTHPNSAGNVVLGAYFARAINGTAFGPAFSGSTVSRTGAVITITPTIPSGATSLTIVDSALDLRRMFRFYPTGTVSNSYPIKSIAISGGTQIVVTLNMDPGAGTVLDAYYGYANPSNDLGIITDNAGRQLRPNYASGTGVYAPLTIAAPSSGGATVVPQHFDVEPLTTVAFSGSNTGPFTGTNSLTNSTVFAPFTSIGGAPITMECWFYMSQRPTDFVYLISHILNIQLSSTGVLIGNFDANGNTTGNTTLAADSTWHHIEMSWDLGNTYALRLFVDGALISNETFSKTKLAYGTDGPFSLLGSYGSVAADGSYTGSRNPGVIRLAEVAIWPTIRHTAAFTPPTTPYVGTEGMTTLYHLNGDLLDSATH